jgi:predicted Zn-dependent protease
VAQLRTARARLAQGLDARPDHAMSLALEGHLLSFADGDTRQSERVLREAVQQGPNEASAWMYLSGVLANTGRGAEAVEAICKAQVRSPLDPITFDMDLFAADAHKAAGDLATALVHAHRSVKANAMHLSSWVQLIILQMLNGQGDEARASASHYLVLRPAASVKRFLDRHPARGTPLAEIDAAALTEAGIPY